MSNIPRDIQRILSTAEHPAILCSWGRDSSLLLHYAREIKPDIWIYYFGDLLPEQGTRLVVNEGATVYSFAPCRAYVSRETLIEEYSFNGVPVPMLSEITKSKNCKHEHMDQHDSGAFFFPHDVVLWGYRRADEHPLLPGVKFEREIQIGHTRFVAPLYDLSDAEVVSDLNRLSLRYVTDEPVEICDSCLHALAGFQERPNLNH